MAKRQSKSSKEGQQSGQRQSKATETVKFGQNFPASDQKWVKATKKQWWGEVGSDLSHHSTAQGKITLALKQNFGQKLALMKILEGQVGAGRDGGGGQPVTHGHLTFWCYGRPCRPRSALVGRILRRRMLPKVEIVGHRLGGRQTGGGLANKKEHTSLVCSVILSPWLTFAHFCPLLATFSHLGVSVGLSRTPGHRPCPRPSRSAGPRWSGSSPPPGTGCTPWRTASSRCWATCGSASRTCERSAGPLLGLLTL